ncbi:MAG TPA: aldo/keto reductase [Bacteroidales bacterium]|nr:aldo/keto reductase [Bacteroidales bacterium]
MTNDYKRADDKVLGIMPVIGLGTWEMTGSGCTDSVSAALKMGYRHIDTAQIYGNEKEVGTGIKHSGINREEIFLTTKVATSNLTPSRIRNTAQESLRKLDTGYIDLLLIHWPTETMDLRSCLSAMFDLRDKGIVKHAGVSNFDPELFREAIDFGPVLTNQVKFTPYHEEFKNLEIAIAHNKIITAYSPLARGSITRDRTLGMIGEKYRKTASQVTLRWFIQMSNISVIPKASSEKHQEENIDIFDFELSAEDMEQIRELGRKPVLR